ncbi:hypothetical protein [Candidatus Methylobacter favarea]|uniref:hypothetical protein n=1 Tax=Candidatus Methylobacter favarea TaxID=2707345 RepID=UPI00157C32FD|nr:hypothetical protein [Candidatus Methylobacter favarea]
MMAISIPRQATLGVANIKLYSFSKLVLPGFDELDYIGKTRLICWKVFLNEIRQIMPLRIHCPQNGFSFWLTNGR